MAWTITYSDGSANHYRFADGAFEYTPVTPERSSTGMYSGGPPRAGALPAAAIDALLAWVHRLEAATALHADDRMKGTGAFSITDATGSRSFIVKRCDALAEFDAFVAEL